MQEPRLIRSAAAFVFVFCTLLISPFATSAGDKPAEIKVAYFQQWPAPVQFAQAKMTFDSLLGMKVNWVPFRSGHDMARALAAGDVQIAYSPGHVPCLEVTEAASQQWSVNPDPVLRLIARTAEMDRDIACSALRSFRFPLATEQKSDAWIDGFVSTYSGEIAHFFVAQGQFEKSLDSYDHFVTARFLP